MNIRTKTDSTGLESIKRVRKPPVEFSSIMNGQNGQKSIKRVRKRPVKFCSINKIGLQRPTASFLKDFKDEIHMLLKKKKKKALIMKGHISISRSLFKYFENNNIKKSYAKNINSFNFLIENNISSIRYYPGDGYNSIIENSFKFKIRKMNPKKYHDRPNQAEASQTKEKFFIFFEFRKQFKLDRTV